MNMLYWTEDENKEECNKCKTSRWKNEKSRNDEGAASTRKKAKKQSAKVLLYFSLIPMLKRLFMSSKTSEDMIWHARDCDTDGMMRHPRDSKAWKDFDLNHPDFAADLRNIRLGLASDGFNPFGAMSTNYSIWPVVLIPYNTPPWKCMKQTNFILSTVIPGPRMIGNEIDICL